MCFGRWGQELPDYLQRTFLEITSNKVETSCKCLQQCFNIERTGNGVQIEWIYIESKFFVVHNKPLKCSVGQHFLCENVV